MIHDGVSVLPLCNSELQSGEFNSRQQLCTNVKKDDGLKERANSKLFTASVKIRQGVGWIFQNKS